MTITASIRKIAPRGRAFGVQRCRSSSSAHGTGGAQGVQQHTSVSKLPNESHHDVRRRHATNIDTGISSDTHSTNAFVLPSADVFDTQSRSPSALCRSSPDVDGLHRLFTAVRHHADEDFAEALAPAFRGHPYAAAGTGVETVSPIAEFSF